jgi:hypothetical protein
MRLSIDFERAELVELWEYWRALPREGLVPDWDIVPAGRRLARLMPYLSLIEVRPPSSLVFRVAGTALCERFGMELTGRDVMEITPAEQRARRYGRYYAVATRPCVLQNRGGLTGGSGTVVAYESLFLPVRRAGQDLPVVLGALIEHRLRHVPADPIAAIPIPDETAFIDIGAGIPAQVP